MLVVGNSLRVPVRRLQAVRPSPSLLQLQCRGVQPQCRGVEGSGVTSVGWV